MAVQMEQINTWMAKSEDMNTHLISFVSQCLNAPSSSVEASLPPAAASSSLSSSTGSLSMAGSSSFFPMFTTAKTSVSNLVEELVALMATTNGTLSPPALAPTPVDSKAVHGKIKPLQFLRLMARMLSHSWSS
ncbi:hypothetical protein QOT17_018776 [Balamuthia mandrillaris]